jgi:hypothetical protein
MEIFVLAPPCFSMDTPGVDSRRLTAFTTAVDSISLVPIMETDS